MDVKYHLKFEQTGDMLADLSQNYLKRGQRRKWILRAVLLVFIFVFLMMLLGPGSSDEGNTSYLSYFIPLVLVLGIWYFLMRWVFKWYFNKQNQSSKTLIGPRELIATEAEFYLNAPASKTTYQWRIIQKLEQSAENYFLYIAANQAIIVPKIAFKNPSEEQAFTGFIERKMSEAGKK